MKRLIPVFSSVAALVAASLLAASGSACAGRPAAQDVQDLAAQPPVLPAMEANVYAPGDASPADPVVSLAAGTQPLDEALSGAAAALAINGDSGMTMADARWAAWRAGYPFRVRAAVTGTTSEPAAPADIVEGLARIREAGDDVGMARARVGESDTWVALVARPIAGLPAFSRQYMVGERIDLGLPAAATWSVVSPDGLRFDGTGPISLRLDADGEWWIEASLPDGRVSLPVYAGMAMPPAPLLDLPGPDAEGPTHALELAMADMAKIRLAFDQPALSLDPTLTTLGRSAIDKVIAGTWDHEAGVQRLRGAGFVDGSADQVWCRSRTVSLCLDGLLASADGRAALLDPGHHIVGVVPRVDSDGVLLLLNLAAR